MLVKISGLFDTLSLFVSSLKSPLPPRDGSKPDLFLLVYSHYHLYLASGLVTLSYPPLYLHDPKSSVTFSASSRRFSVASRIYSTELAQKDR